MVVMLQICLELLLPQGGLPTSVPSVLALVRTQLGSFGLGFVVHWSVGAHAVESRYCNVNVGDVRNIGLFL